MKVFSKNDEQFVCKNCKKKVEPLKYTSRNHCPHCLWSLHVDINPGDRQNPCQGLMKPIDIEISSKKGYVVVHKCQVCGKIKRNVCANDDSEKLILKIISKS